MAGEGRCNRRVRSGVIVKTSLGYMGDVSVSTGGRYLLDPAPFELYTHNQPEFDHADDLWFFAADRGNS